MAADEDQDDLSDTFRNDGPTIQHDLQGRAHSALNQDLKEVGHSTYPDKEFAKAGKGIEQQGKVAEDVGEGGHDVNLFS